MNFVRIGSAPCQSSIVNLRQRFKYFYRYVFVKTARSPRDFDVKKNPFCDIPEKNRLDLRRSDLGHVNVNFGNKFKQSLTDRTKEKILTIIIA